MMPLSDPSPPRILSRGLLLLFVAAFGTMTSFYLQLSVVPLYASAVGAGGIGAGLSTGVLMFATVAAELATPRLVGRFGYRLVFAAGVLLLGLPALALLGSATMAAIFAVSLVRGVGLAIVVVVGGSVVASLVPQARRAEGFGLYGVVVGVPSVMALPFGVWLAGHAGYPTVFVVGGVSALSGLVVVPALPRRAPALEPPVGVLAGIRTTALVRPALIFSTTAMAAGVVVTFLPLAVQRATGSLAALGLLAYAVAATLVRWWAGRFGDRTGQAGLLVGGVLAAATGMLALGLSTAPAAVLIGLVLLGGGFGVAQNASLTLMLDRVSPAGYDTVSALWNLAYDAGLGVGATVFGVIAAQAGYPAAFALTGILILGALVPAWRRRTWLVPREEEAIFEPIPRAGET